MAVSQPRISGYGSTFGVVNGVEITTLSPNGYINTSSLGNTRQGDVHELNYFEEVIKDFVKGSLGYPVIRVELTDYQLKLCMDEGIAKLDYHCPLWSKQLAVFDASAGQNIYELPAFIANNIDYVTYKKTLLSIQSQAGTLEFDFFIKYFQDNFLMSNFSVSNFYVMQSHLEGLRKILSQEGSWDILDNRFLQLYPTPVTTPQQVIISYRALNSNTILPIYRNWIQRYALAKAKGILGQIRGKYKTLPSPGGGAQLNGMELIAESKEEIEKLNEELLYEIEEFSFPITAY